MRAIIRANAAAHGLRPRDEIEVELDDRWLRRAASGQISIVWTDAEDEGTPEAADDGADEADGEGRDDDADEGSGPADAILDVQ
ncbi:MAG: hypothetical protein ABR616_18245 [Dermatophilaceae bacterium]